MCAASRSTRFRVPQFWIWHCIKTFLKFSQSVVTKSSRKGSRLGFQLLNLSRRAVDYKLRNYPISCCNHTACDLQWYNQLVASQPASLVFQLFADVFQRSPARVWHRGHAITIFNIQVAATLRTQSLAFGGAYLLYWQRQQHLLFQHIFQQQPFALIVPDLS